MDKKILFLIILGILIFGIRLVNINEAIYDDESNFAYSVTVMNEFGYNEDYYSPQPLNLIYKPFIALFGLETWVFRIVPWLFGIINTIFVYIFARRNWGRQVAFWSSFLMLVSFYPTLASLQFDVEGNLVMFSILLMFFSYLEYEKISALENFKKFKDKQLFWQILSGIGLGIAVVSKYNSVYIILIIALYSLIKRNWDIKQSFRDLFLVYLVGFLLFCCYVLLAIIQSPQNWLNFIWVIGFDRYDGSRTGTHFGLMGISMYLLWSTPLLFGFYLISIFQWVKKNILLFLWVTITILFYTFILPTAGSMDRYFMHTIPALAILGGYYLSKIKFETSDYQLISILILCFTGLFFVLNSFPLKYVARFPSLYLNELKHLNPSFLFSYTSASGPTFGVNFVTILISFSLAFLSLLVFILLRKRNISSIFLMVFLVVSISFNIFLVSEYLFHPTGVDVSEVKLEMIDYVKENNLAYPIYTNDQGIQWYFENDYWHKDKFTHGFGDNEVGYFPEHEIGLIRQNGGTIILLRWPPLPHDSPAFEVIKECKVEKQFYDKNIILGEVYGC